MADGAHMWVFRTQCIAAEKKNFEISQIYLNQIKKIHKNAVKIDSK